MVLIASAITLITKEHVPKAVLIPSMSVAALVIAGPVRRSRSAFIASASAELAPREPAAAARLVGLRLRR